MLSCGGQIVFPPGYLEAVYLEMRAEGAVCVADEVRSCERILKGTRGCDTWRPKVKRSAQRAPSEWATGSHMWSDPDTLRIRITLNLR